MIIVGNSVGIADMAKEAKKLGDKQVAALKTPGFYSVGGVPGLALRIALKTGSDGLARSWILRTATGEVRTSSTGKLFTARRDFGLGGYPDVSLAEARQKAAEIRRQLRAGIDPVAEKKSARMALLVARSKERTFADVAKDCHSVRVSEFGNPKHAAQWITTLERYAYPYIGHLPVSEINTAHIAELLRPIWIVRHETATRVRQRIAVVLDYAVAAGLRTGANPADARSSLKDLLPKSSAVRRKAGGTKHHARVPVAQIPAFMADLRTRISISAKALEFAILTASRSREVREATWREVNLDSRVWCIAPERMKTRKAHRVPLSNAVIELLESLPRNGEICFTSTQGRALSDAALSKLVKDMHTQAIKAGGIGYLDPANNRIATPHGTARSSFKDWCRTRPEYPDEWSELALAHVSSDATRAAYARDGLLEERRLLMQAWADFCYAKP